MNEMMKTNKTASEKWFNWSTIYDKSDDPSPYMTRITIGRLRLHIFYRGDLDPDCHDHPWDFWTFPLTSYVEEVVEKKTGTISYFSENPPDFVTEEYTEHVIRRNVVWAFRWHFRPATHTHRVLGRFTGRFSNTPNAPDAKLLGSFTAIGKHSQRMCLSAGYEPLFTPGRKVVTIVWRSKKKREWGFLKNRDGKWCWTGFQDYIWGGGKDAPCND